MTRRHLLILLGVFAAIMFESLTSHSDEPVVREQRMHQLINDRRHDLGLPRLEVRPFLRSYAERRSNDLRARWQLYHDPCKRCGEVIGVTGGSTWRIFIAWIESPPHRAILLDRDATRLGCGMVGGRYDWWTCEVRY